MDTVRQSKVSRLIQKELAKFFMVEGRTAFPGRLVTVTIVRITPDLSLAKVYLSVFPKKKDEDFVALVTQQSKHIRAVLGRNIRNQVRVVPELAFYIDDSIDYLEHIDELLKS